MTVVLGSVPPSFRFTIWRALAALGRGTRVRARFLLAILALSFGVIRELPRPTSWRRTIRFEFRRELQRAVIGGLLTTLVAASLIGLAIVYQAIFWLRQADQDRLIGAILVTVLVREVAPVIVGLILLGRSGIATTTEIGRLQLDGNVDKLMALGIDPFLFLALPRAAAFSLASYTLGVFFAMAALAVGFVAGNVFAGSTASVWVFFFTVLEAMQPADFTVFPAKLLIIGLLVALVAVLSGVSTQVGDDISNLLPRTFVRGTLAILLTSVVLSMAI